MDNSQSLLLSFVFCAQDLWRDLFSGKPSLLCCWLPHLTLYQLLVLRDRATWMFLIVTFRSSSLKLKSSSNCLFNFLTSVNVTNVFPNSKPAHTLNVVRATFSVLISLIPLSCCGCWALAHREPSLVSCLLTSRAISGSAAFVTSSQLPQFTAIIFFSASLSYTV